MDKKKKRIFIVIVSLLIVISVSFAYFVIQIGKDTSVDVNVNTDDLDDLKFEVSKNINLSADQFNFASGKGDISDNAIAKASLKANSTNNLATYNYYVYFNVLKNNYIYTTSDNKPEIVLTITNPNGAEVTSVDGLSYVSVTNASGDTIKGFDITTSNGLINIANNYEITSNSSTNYITQEWTFKVTFVNLDSDQSKNGENSMEAQIVIQKDKALSSLADVCSSGDNLAECIKKLGDNSFSTLTNIYVHNTSLENGAGDGSYRYAGPSDTTNNFVCFGYDSQDGTCPSDNLYRIIGVFDNQVKLIKYDYAKSTLLGTDGDYYNTYKGWEGSSSHGTNKGQNSKEEIGVYYWNNNTSNNTWSESRLNTVNLNKNYINKIDENGTKWSEKISDHTWKVGGNTWSNIAEQTAPTAYQNEINNPATNKTVNAKVGLMYVSDYGYAASSNYWSTALNSYNNVIANNWMYMGLYEWTLAPQTDISDHAFGVGSSGIVDGDYVNGRFVGGNIAARPVLYLTSETAYVSGNGTLSKPYIID